MDKFDMVVELMVENGVTAKIPENVIEKIAYGEPVFDLDFTKHDKPFEDRIKSLQDENYKLHNQLMKTEKDYQKEFERLNNQITELENYKCEICKNEPETDIDKPSVEWYEDRHQQDCIEINRLNTTIDVLIHKIEYLRQFSGLE